MSKILVVSTPFYGNTNLILPISRGNLLGVANRIEKLLQIRI